MILNTPWESPVEVRLQCQILKGKGQMQRKPALLFAGSAV